MHPLPVFNLHLAVLTTLIVSALADTPGKPSETFSATPLAQPSSASVCNCTITQSGVTYPISSLIGTESAVAFYDYGNPNGSSANTGLELPDALILFLYEDANTGIISLFLIADIGNSGSGGSMTFEANCLPPAAFVSVQDDGGEFNGSPPLITGNWNWSGCCTDGGVIENIGCSNSINLDLLVSSGLDSIVWLTGDIANPTQLLLAMTGEAITINCGGGVCCPIGLDTEVTVTDATCPDTPDGVISLVPQDGVPAYTYDWSNGASTATNSGLVPGSYMVTVTDSQGCTEELTISVGFSPGSPPAQAATIELCSVNAADYFDLTSINEDVNLNSGFNVLWFENPDMTGAIADPSNYLSGTTTVYAVVDNGFCLSDPVPVNLVLNVEPIATAASLNACEENNEMAFFDLTTLEFIISNGMGEVIWYHDILLTNEIGDPEEFFTVSTTVYAVIDNGPCISQPVEIELIVDLKPEGDPTEAHLCGDVNDEAIFDLTLLENDITGGNGIVSWYLEFELLDPITSPSSFQTTTTTVYAVVFDGICYSDGIPVNLVVEPIPTGNPASATLCGDASGEAIFNLWNYASLISGGAGAVEWYLDSELFDPISNPDAFLTGSTIIFAVVDNGTCISEPIPITLIVTDGLMGNPASLQTCADANGEGLFDLLSLDTTVSGGIGIVQWYDDPLGNNIIIDPGQYLSSGTIVYALITDGACQSQLIPVSLTIIDAVTANPTQSSLCDEGSGSAVFNLISLENNISGGIGQVNWYSDPAGTIPISNPGLFSSSGTTVYANVTAGSCSSEIVTINLNVLTTPVSMDLTIDTCGNAAGESIIDLTLFNAIVSGNIGTVTWFGDASLNSQINNPASFLTGDTLIYAVVSNGNCTSMPAEIQITVSQQLIANAFVLELCKDQGENIIIDLTESNSQVGGGLQVLWYTDAAGITEILSPNAFIATASQTIYAGVTDGKCTSPLVPIGIMIMDWPSANPFAIKKCGDASGQVTLDLTTVESIVSENTGTVNWYADSMLSIEINNANNFVSGDTTIFALVTNGFCISGPVAVTLEIVDSLVANSLMLESCAVFDDTAVINLSLSDFIVSGGNGTVYWFNDELGLDTITDPSSFATNSDTVYAMVTADGCISNLAAIPIDVFIPSATPEAGCDSSSFGAIEFTWTGDDQDFGYEYVINNGTASGPFQTSDFSLILDGLNGGDVVTLALWGIGLPPCGNSDTLILECMAKQCPEPTLEIVDGGSHCSEDDPVQLDVVITGLSQNAMITWSGDGITDPSGIFDPNLVGAGNHSVTVTADDGGCVFTASANVPVNASPEASFIIDGTPCIDSLIKVSFTGSADLSAEWNWDFGEAEVITDNSPVDFLLKWNTPGTHEVSLWIDDQGCGSELFTLPVEMEAPLDPPVIICQEEDYFSVSVSWDPVAGATDYIVSSSAGTGKLSGNIYTITNLPDDTHVTISVTAVGSACGPSSSSIECQTLDYIPLEYFIPDVFTPNGDGINDIFFVHSNTQVAEVSICRIFDRWGDMVFEDFRFLPNDPQHGWDGSYAEKEMNPGVYIYWIELKTLDGDIVRFTGDLTLLK